MILLLCQAADVSQLINVIAAVTYAHCVPGLAAATAFAASSFPCLYMEGLGGER